MNELEEKALQAEQERIANRRREAYKADQERIAALEAQVRDLLSIIPAEELARLESERNRATLRIERLEAQVRVAKTMRKSAELHRDMERKNVSTLIKTLRKAHVDVPNLLYSNEADKAWGWYMQRLERLEEALRFYAYGENYYGDMFNQAAISLDKGDIARHALESEDSE